MSGHLKEKKLYNAEYVHVVLDTNHDCTLAGKRGTEVNFAVFVSGNMGMTMILLPGWLSNTLINVLMFVL